MENYDFSGWATKNNVKCSDGRIIRQDTFKHNDGSTVPLVWNHQHNEAFDVLGHAQLENREEGVYAYCKFNDTESGKTAKLLVQHGDVNQLSIYANQLQQQGPNVMHGVIREVSLVLAGANPEAYIMSVIKHGDALEYADESDEGIIYTGENIELFHSENNTESKTNSNNSDDKKEDESVAETEKKEKTVQEIYDEMSDEQKDVVAVMVGMALEENNVDDDDDEEGDDETMKHNLFDVDEMQSANVLTHSDEQEIIALAKSNNVGSFRAALNIFAQNNNDKLAHGFENYGELFPEYKDLKTGAPELLTDDQSWVEKVINKTHKSPISRIRTRQADARKVEALRALGYKKGEKKTNIGNISLLSRTFDPQTIYVKDALNRDDIIDITDFDVIEYNYRLMNMILKEEIATAIIFGDGRDLGDPNKIKEAHVCPIWTDDELYTIHEVVDIEAAKTELQGTNTGASFSENYIYAEAIIRSALYAREQYKGSGALDFYCTPHLLNVMLLARDMNGRRIYDSKTDLAAALNVREIVTIEQMEGKTRTVEGGTRELLGIFYNFADYQIGATKGGEITRFNQFDIDFNQEKMLIETRISGANTRVKSAIVLEKPTVSAAG